jgi:hypothetical protein
MGVPAPRPEFVDAEFAARRDRTAEIIPLFAGLEQIRVLLEDAGAADRI